MTTMPHGMTMCWHCSHSYSSEKGYCPECAVANPAAYPFTAQQQRMSEALKRMSGLEVMELYHALVDARDAISKDAPYGLHTRQLMAGRLDAIIEKLK